MPVSRVRVRALLCGWTCVCLLFSLPSQARPDRTLGARAERRPRHVSCGTTRDDEAGRTKAVVPLSDGTPLSFMQEPRILQPAWRGGVRLRDLVIAGDVPQIAFRRSNATEDVTWTRARTDAIDGRLVSVFDLEWPDSEVEATLRLDTAAFDYPDVYWGSLTVPGDTGSPRGIHLRAASAALPGAEVVRIDDTVQFSSHVVNIVVPSFGSARLSSGSRAFELTTLARRFYEHFADQYDGLAVVPQADAFAEYTAFHRNVQNAVGGTGLPKFDNSALYGSAGRLQGVEVFLQASVAAHDVSNHEISHQWGHELDWTRITGVTRAGWEPSAHAPLMAGPESLIGAVLGGTRRVKSAGDVYEIERTPYPVRQHPLELYAMGLLAPQDVPDVELFEDQGQFGDSRYPSPGTPVTGPVRRAGINDIMAAHGPRTGPVTHDWARATIVVSRDGLLSQAEMDYWNFFAARLEDPGRSGVPARDGHVSFDVATGRLVDLRTAIVPRHAAPVPPAANVDAPSFGATDCRDLSLYNSVPSVLDVNREIRLDGRVAATDRAFDQLLVRLWRYGGTTNTALLFLEPVSTSGSFNARIRAREGEQGLYVMEVFLFWPESGAQFPRCTLAPVWVR
jgi:hypothetical protein